MAVKIFTQMDRRVSGNAHVAFAAIHCNFYDSHGEPSACPKLPPKVQRLACLLLRLSPAATSTAEAAAASAASVDMERAAISGR